MKYWTLLDFPEVTDVRPLFKSWEAITNSLSDILQLLIPAVLILKCFLRSRVLKSIRHPYSRSSFRKATVPNEEQRDKYRTSPASIGDRLKCTITFLLCERHLKHSANNDTTALKYFTYQRTNTTLKSYN